MTARWRKTQDETENDLARGESEDYLEDESPRSLPPSAWGSTKPRYGNIPVLVFSKGINDWIKTDALADTGSLGKDANVVSPRFLKTDLGLSQRHYDSHRAVPFRGLGGRGYTEGSISLKIARLYENQYGQLVRDNSMWITFLVHPDFESDILLGRDFLEQNESFRPHWAIKDKPDKQSQNDYAAAAAERQRREVLRLSVQQAVADRRSPIPSLYAPYSASPQPGYGNRDTDPTRRGPDFGTIANGGPASQQNSGRGRWGSPNERDEAHARYSSGGTWGLPNERDEAHSRYSFLGNSK